MEGKNTGDTELGKKVWEAACKLRGNLNAASYREIVLGLLFLKYISDHFAFQSGETEKQVNKKNEEKEKAFSAQILFVPEESRWTAVEKDAELDRIGKTLDRAMEGLERENACLRGLLPKNFSRPKLDQRRLGQVVRLFSSIQPANMAEEKDLFGRVYEYCLMQFSMLEGKLAGEFYTPSCIVRTLVEMLQPYDGKVYDPCCGSGGMFVQSAEFIQNHGGSSQDISIYGQDLNPDTLKLAKLNLAIRGIYGDLGPKSGDTFFNDWHPELKADYIMANPPFNLSDWGREELKEDVRWQYGLPPAGNGNFAWLQHMLWHLSDRGKIGVVLANGALASRTGGEDEIRRRIVKADLVDCIVSLPRQLFYTTQIPVSLWILSKKKEQKGKILFLDGRELGKMVSKKLRELTEQDIAKISESYHAYREGKLRPERGFSAAVSVKEVEAKDFILIPGLYVGFASCHEKTKEERKAEMERLTGQLEKMFEMSHKLEMEIWQQLEKIRYDI